MSSTPTPTPAPAAPVVTLGANLEFPPRTVTQPDPDGSLVTRYNVTGMCQLVRVGATCDTPGKSIALRVYWIDQQGRGVNAVAVTFTSPAKADWGTVCVGLPGGDFVWPLAGAKQVAVKVDVITGGTWTLWGAMG